MSPPRLVTLLTTVGVTLAVAAPEPPASVLYVKAKNTHLKASSQPSARTLDILQPGHSVTYLGREGTTSWHKVTSRSPQGTFTGVIYQANLSSSPPSLEVLSAHPDKPISPTAFASSGAAVKALGPGAIAYGQSLSRPESVAQLEALEKVAERLQDDDVAKYARAGGLPEVLGTSKPEARAATGKGKTPRGTR
ncbi:SH3 domain-containing protein [Melittangium boletus]|uniref:SH3 domain-containing protein n=1 Tax=Melittangium boletus TaxID=83453 RepID=UPI003DA25D81